MEFLTIKDIILLTGYGKTQASKINKDIKEHYKLRSKITLEHYKDYFKIPINTD
jgi:hypothetical protein